MKTRLLPVLLAFCLVLALLPCAALAAAARESCVVEVRSAAELSEKLGDPPAAAKSAGTDRTAANVLVFAPSLPSACGAQRVVHYAAYQEYVLTFAACAAAEQAYETLTGLYGPQNVWLDTPEQAAHAFEDEPVSYTANTWGADFMHLTAYRNDPIAHAHFDAAEPVVAIIDSGADTAAANLMQRSYESYDVVNGQPGVSEIHASISTKGHGTRVASLLDAMLPGSVRFMYLRVFDEEGEASRTNVTTAIQYAVEHGADVINMSLGWDDDKQQTFAFLDEALTAARKAGITVVCACGNGTTDMKTVYPANHEYTIAVSAVARNLTPSSYSNYGELVDFCAPGSGITASTVGGAQATCNGTSFAAPHITAAAAQLKILEPNALPGRIYALLHSCALDVGLPGKDANYGWGIPVLPEDIADRISHDKSCSYVEACEKQAPTCTEAGHEGGFRCAICGMTVEESRTLPALEHSWGAWMTTTRATVTSEGIQTRTCDRCGETETRAVEKLAGALQNPFTDVTEGKYYYEPVLWALSHDPQITDGTTETTFSPSARCTRGQVVTFLWRAMGCAEPTKTDNPFTDVSSGDYFYKAVLWAVEKGITDGTSATTFSPNDPCTRAHVVTFLWRAEDKPDAGSNNPFNDVSGGQYYTDSVLWAVSKGITDGTSDTTFSPDAPCTRGQIVTFLYRDMK